MANEIVYRDEEIEGDLKWTVTAYSDGRFVVVGCGVDEEVDGPDQLHDLDQLFSVEGVA